MCRYITLFFCSKPFNRHFVNILLFLFVFRFLGSMSLTTVTLALDDKLRSLRNSSFDSDKDLDLDTSIDSTINHQPLTLGENIPFADESPERPLIQSRSKPVRVSTYSIPTSRYTTRLYSHGSTSPNSPQDALSSSQSHSSQENVKVGTTSDDTDASTTSNAMETFSSTVRIDRDMIREMNRILTTLERKATKLNRSLSLNYKNNKGECCCNMNNMNNNYRQQGGGGGGGGSTRLPLTKDEKTDKNINKKRQIQDGKSRRYTNRSIKRRHTVGGTHDYDVNKSGQNVRCRQGHQMGGDQTIGQRASSPDLVKDNHIDKVICVNECWKTGEINVEEKLLLLCKSKREIIQTKTQFRFFFFFVFSKKKNFGFFNCDIWWLIFSNVSFSLPYSYFNEIDFFSWWEK